MNEEDVSLELVEKSHYRLEVLGYSCPYPELFARRALKKISSGDILELMTDNKPSTEQVPARAQKEGHEVLGVKQDKKTVWIIQIRKK